ALDRLPSAVYWSGLGAWGIRRFDGSQERYHASVDQLYERRRGGGRAQESAVQRREAGDAAAALLSVVTWHPKLPPIPVGFPEWGTIAPEPGEAQFPQGQIVTTQRDSLLARLVVMNNGADVEFPWEHPRKAAFAPA